MLAEQELKITELDQPYFFPSSYQIESAAEQSQTNQKYSNPPSALKKKVYSVQTEPNATNQLRSRTTSFSTPKEATTQGTTRKIMQSTKYCISNALRKMLKRLFWTVRAAVRWRRVAKISDWSIGQQKLKSALIGTKRLETITQRKLTNWLQGVTNKSLSYTNDELCDFTISKNKLLCDQSVIKIANSTLFLFENLGRFTKNDFMALELKQSLYLQLFQQTNKNSSRFVLGRTFLKSAGNRNITDEQVGILCTESFLFHQIAQFLFRSALSNTFLVKMLVSILQIQFINYFKQMPIVNTQCEVPLMQIIETSNSIQIQYITNSKQQEIIIDGLYGVQYLTKLFELRPKLKDQLTGYFKEIVQNLTDSIKL